MYVCLCLSLCLSIHPPTYISIYLSICHLSFYHLSFISLFIYPSINHLSVCLSFSLSQLHQCKLLERWTTSTIRASASQSIKGTWDQYSLVGPQMCGGHALTALPWAHAFPSAAPGTFPYLVSCELTCFFLVQLLPAHDT